MINLDQLYTVTYAYKLFKRVLSAQTTGTRGRNGTVAAKFDIHSRTGVWTLVLPHLQHILH